LGNFSKTNIIKGFIGSFFFSLFIYIDFFGLENKALFSITALIAIYLFLSLDKKSIFWYGFFVGVLWFWWISISFIYYELVYLIPFIVLFFGIAYGVFFYILTLFDKWNLRFLAIFAFSFFEPFGFNWFKMELLFVNSYFYADKITLLLVLVIFALILYFQSRLKPVYLILFLIPLVFVLDFTKPTSVLPEINMYLPQMDIPQDLKWSREYKETLILKNLEIIHEAIEQKAELVVLPEAVFAFALNLDKELMGILKRLSLDIDIVTGGMYYDGQNFNNSTYFFSQENVQIANKVVLVPFGEAIPLPKFFVDLINNIFFNGAPDFVPAKNPTDFVIQGVKFRNAICYEATKDEIYEDNPPFVIAISNNAWFTPSTQPTMQKLLMKYYAKKHNSVIYSVANGSQSLIITP
jgi:apolipoprotein N-acyltransferase